MKLYYSPGACSMAPHIVATETGHQSRPRQGRHPQQETADGGDFYKVNPKGYVPALQLDNGEVLTEVGVICQYLADQKPESGLAPKAGTMERYHQMEAVNFAATEVHKQIGALFNPKMTPESKEIQGGNIDKRLTTLEKALEGKAIHHGRQVHGPRRLSLHGAELDEPAQVRPRQVPEHQGLHGPCRCKAESAGDAEGRRSRQALPASPARLWPNKAASASA